VTKVLGNLVGICPVCEALIYRRVNVARLEQVRGNLDITRPQGPLHIGGSTDPSVNDDFRREPSNHADAQPQE